MKKSKPTTNSLRRYKLSTEKNNQIIIEEINRSEIEALWKTFSDIHNIF